MSVLAIDTASRSRVVVVLATADGELIQGVALQGQSVGALLPRAMTPMLSMVRRAVVVVTGPGTYTGVRAGMAAALGVAQALGLPLHGVVSLEVTASAPMPELGPGAWVVADAGRGALYVARKSDPGNPQRIMGAAFDPDGQPVASTEPIALEGLVAVDPVLALAASVVRAVSRPPLDPVGLTAMYVD
ncbi:MAG: tRNA (adenosine(37)-N6)-threonylcarbamoyltransferase complex dimerization subunit type 1 TsaB [Candidatus Dormiibacterota bacterium]